MKHRNIGHLTLHTYSQPIPKFTVSWNLIGGVIPANYQNEVIDLINNSKNNTLKDNSTVYLTPLSELPSYKLKNYIEENKLKINTARKLEKIDTIIINEDFINKNYSKISSWNTTLQSHEFNAIDTYLIFPSQLITKDAKFDRYIQDHNWNRIDKKGKKDITHYCISTKEYETIVRAIPYFATIKDKCEVYEGTLFEGGHGSKSAMDSIDFYLDLINIVKKYKLNVVLDSKLNEEINKGLVIDFEVFQNLFGMLKSSDPENHRMAKEIIANCEYETSKAYIIALYNMFPSLKRTDNNKNYALIRKRLDAKGYGSIVSKNYIPGFESLLKHFTQKCPELLPQLLPCLVYRLNDMSKKEVIKEIILAHTGVEYLS